LRLYRYRTIKNALLELENGTFYFAEPKELNDPIEGYVKIFWQGDKAAWQELLKNFVCSLFYKLQTYLLMEQNLGGRRKNYNQDYKNQAVIMNLHLLGTSSLNKIFNRLTEEFLSKNSVQEVVNFYSSGKFKCSGKETEFILQSVIDYACHLCVKECKSLSLIKNDFDENFFDVAYEISFEELKNLSDNERKQKIDEIENFNSDAMESGLMALKLNQRNITDSNYELKQQILNLKIFFPRIYVEHLKEIIYPAGYIVCFSETPTNSAMWGNYSDNHAGICFIYETEHYLGREFINFGKKSLEVKSIKYDEQIIEQNFFDALSHLNFLNVEGSLTGLKGLKSSKFNESDIADKYDNIYCEKFYRKTFDWYHEKEYRIFLPDKFQHYTNKFSRTLKYDLKTLKGIIFGLRTTLEDKLELIQKLIRLRKSVNDFEFYQAEFDDDMQKIYVREKFLLVKSLEEL